MYVRHFFSFFNCFINISPLIGDYHTPNAKYAPNGRVLCVRRYPCDPLSRLDPTARFWPERQQQTRTRTPNAKKKGKRPGVRSTPAIFFFLNCFINVCTLLGDHHPASTPETRRHQQRGAVTCRKRDGHGRAPRGTRNVDP